MSRAIGAFRVAIFGLIALLLNGCSLTNLEDWPEELPNVEYFIATYEADPVNQEFQDLSVYLYWVVAFYQGNVAYPTGWSDIEDIILSQTGEHIDPEFSAELSELGITIGAEWAKENPIRKIDNRLLSMWGSILQIALSSDLHREAVAQVSADIAALFADEIQSQELVDARYEELLGLELFSSF